MTTPELARSRTQLKLDSLILSAVKGELLMLHCPDPLTLGRTDPDAAYALTENKCIYNVAATYFATGPFGKRLWEVTLTYLMVYTADHDLGEADVEGHQITMYRDLHDNTRQMLDWLTGLMSTKRLVVDLFKLTDMGV